MIGVKCTDCGSGYRKLNRLWDCIYGSGMVVECLMCGELFIVNEE